MKKMKDWVLKKKSNKYLFIFEGNVASFTKFITIVKREGGNGYLIFLFQIYF